MPNGTAQTIQFDEPIPQSVQFDAEKPHVQSQEEIDKAVPPPKPYFGFTPSNLYEQGKRGIRELAGGVYGMGKDVLFPEGNNEGERLHFLAKKYILDPADAESEKARTAPTAMESIGHSVASAIPLVGPWAASLGEQAGSGDVGGAMVRGGSQVAAAELSSPILRAARVGTGMARDAMGNYIHDARTGELKPGAKTAAQVTGGLAGGAAGGLLGHEAIGGYFAGRHLGPSLADTLFPESVRRVTERAEDAAYEQKAQDLTRRDRERRAIDRRSEREAKASDRATIRSPFEGATSSSIRTTPFSGEQTLPPAKEAAPAMPRVKSRADVQVETNAPSSVFPEPRSESRTARPGAMWSVPRTELPDAAMRGTPGAGDVLQNTGRTVLYEPRGAIGTGKSVTRFTSEGVPIQEGLPHGNATPFEKSIRETSAPALRSEVQGLVRSPAMEVPEWRAQERSYELQKARDILRNSNATDEEKAVAQTRLKENE